MRNYTWKGASKLFSARLFGFMAWLIMTAGLNAQSVIPTYYVGVFFVLSGDSNDAAKWSDVQKMVHNLNTDGTGYIFYTAYQASTFQQVANTQLTNTDYKYVLAEGVFSNDRSTFLGKLADTAGQYPLSALPHAQHLSYWHCGMDGDNRLLNVDDFGSRMGDGGYHSVSPTGPLSPLSPGFWQWGMARYFYTLWGGGGTLNAGWVSESVAWMDWNATQTRSTPTYTESFRFKIISCDFLNN